MAAEKSKGKEEGVTMIVELQLKAEKDKEFRDYFKSTQEKTLKEGTVNRYTLHQAVDKDNEWKPIVGEYRLVEDYKSKAAFASHFEQPHTKELLEKLKDMLAAPPGIHAHNTDMFSDIGYAYKAPSEGEKWRKDAGGVTVVVTFNVVKEKEKDFVDSFRAAATETRKEKLCVRYSLHEALVEAKGSEKVEGRYRLVEDYTSKEAFNDHFKSDYVQNALKKFETDKMLKDFKIALHTSDVYC